MLSAGSSPYYNDPNNDSRIDTSDTRSTTLIGSFVRTFYAQPSLGIAHRSKEWLPRLSLPPSYSLLRRYACYTFHVFNTPDSRVGKIVFAFIGSAIFVSVLSFCLATLPEYRNPDVSQPVAFFYIDLVCLIVFTVDYGLRLVTCVAVPWSDEGAQPSSWVTHLWLRVFRKFVRFIISPFNIIDAIAIFPSFAAFSSNSGVDARRLLILRAVRLARIVR
jgi:hypothetical protein